MLVGNGCHELILRIQEISCTFTMEYLRTGSDVQACNLWARVQDADSGGQTGFFMST